MRSSIIFPAIDSTLPVLSGAQSLDQCTLAGVDNTVDEENSSSRSQRDSIGRSSTSSWSTGELHPPEHDGLSKHQRRSSVELKMSAKWSEEKENVCFCRSVLVEMRIALIYIDRRCENHTTTLYHWEVKHSAESSCLH